MAKVSRCAAKCWCKLRKGAFSPHRLLVCPAGAPPVECAAFFRPHSSPLITMYAVIATGGKQYRVSKDGLLRVEKLDAEPGATVDFGEVLLVGEGADVKLGKPLLKGGKVVATVVRHGKSAKVSIVKFRRRKHYLRQGTHRQFFTEVKVTDISAGW